MQNPGLAIRLRQPGLREKLPDEEASLSLAVNLAERADGGDELSRPPGGEILPRTSEDNAREPSLRALAKTQETLRARTPEEGIEAWRRLLELVPSGPEAHGALARLYARPPGGLRDCSRCTAGGSRSPRTRGAPPRFLYETLRAQDGPLHDTVGGDVHALRRLLELKPGDIGAGAAGWLLRAASAGRSLARASSPGGWPSRAGNLDLDLRFRLAVVRETRLLDKLGAPRETLRADPSPRNRSTSGHFHAQLEAIDPARAAAEGRSGGAAHRLPDRGRCPEARRAPRPPASAPRPKPSSAKQLLVEAGRAARGGARRPAAVFTVLRRALSEDPQRRLAPTPAGAHRRSGPGARSSWPAPCEEGYPSPGPRRPRRCSSKLGERLYEKGRLAASGQGHRRQLEKAREQDPALAHAALTGLARLYGQAGAQRPAGGVLDETGGDPRRQRAGQRILFRLGQVAQDEAGGRGPRHRRSFERLLALDKTRTCRRRVAGGHLRGRTVRPTASFGVLRIQRDLTPPGRSRSSILSKMVRGLRRGGWRPITRPPSRQYSEAVPEEPQVRPGLQRALEQALEKAERWEDLRALLAGKIPQTADPRIRSRSARKLGRILYRKLGRAEEAWRWRALRQALERDARNRSALETLRKDIRRAAPDAGRSWWPNPPPAGPAQGGHRGVEGPPDAPGGGAGRDGPAGRRRSTLPAARWKIEPHTVADPGPGGGSSSGCAARLRRRGAGAGAEGRGVAATGGRGRGVVSTLFEIAEVWISRGQQAGVRGARSSKRVLEFDPANRDAYERVLKLYAPMPATGGPTPRPWTACPAW